MSKLTKQNEMQLQTTQGNISHSVKNADTSSRKAITDDSIPPKPYFQEDVEKSVSEEESEDDDLIKQVQRLKQTAQFNSRKR